MQITKVFIQMKIKDFGSYFLKSSVMMISIEIWNFNLIFFWNFLEWLSFSSK